MPDFVYDLIILFILALCAFQGYRRGFVLTLFGFLALFVAFLGGMFLADQLCQPVGRLIQPAIETSLHKVLDSTVLDALDPAADPGAPGSSAGDSSGDAQPAPPTQAQRDAALAHILEAMSTSPLLRGFVDSVEQVLDQSIAEATQSAVKAISAYVAREVARIVLFFVCFLVVLVGWTLLAHGLDLAFKLPVLSTLNAWSGFGVGLLKGTALVMIAVWLLKGRLIGQQTIDSTILLKFFCENGPLTAMAQFFS